LRGKTGIGVRAGFELTLRAGKERVVPVLVLLLHGIEFFRAHAGCHEQHAEDEHLFYLLFHFGTILND